MSKIRIYYTLNRDVVETIIWGSMHARGGLKTEAAVSPFSPEKNASWPSKALGRLLFYSYRPKCH